MLREDGAVEHVRQHGHEEEHKSHYIEQNGSLNDAAYEQREAAHGGDEEEERHQVDGEVHLPVDLKAGYHAHDRGQRCEGTADDGQWFLSGRGWYGVKGTAVIPM